MNRGNSGWDTQMKTVINGFIKKRVFQKKRQYQSTYSRVKRGSGFIKFGEPISPGRKVKEDKMTLNMAFYVDKSGSMYNCISQVYDAAYTVADAMKKNFGKDPVIDQTEFRMYAFDEDMHLLKWGQKTNASSGNMSFEEMCEFMENNTKEYLINVFITDAQFTITPDKVEKIIKDHDGIILFITNVPNATMKALAQKEQNKTKLFYIEASEDFTLDGKKD